MYLPHRITPKLPAHLSGQASLILYRCEMELVAFTLFPLLAAHGCQLAVIVTFLTGNHLIITAY